MEQPVKVGYVETKSVMTKSNAPLGGYSVNPYSPLVDFYNRIHPTMRDVIILLGDVGLYFYGSRLDKQMKIVLNDLDTTFFCIHGNHEMRPATIPTYEIREWNGGTVWYWSQIAITQYYS